MESGRRRDVEGHMQGGQGSGSTSNESRSEVLVHAYSINDSSHGKYHGDIAVHASPQQPARDTRLLYGDRKFRRLGHLASVDIWRRGEVATGRGGTIFRGARGLPPID